MLDPSNKIDANSTLEVLPRRQLLLKFVASIILVGFLLGLMLGRIFAPQPLPQRSPSIVQLQTYADGLAVCLSQSAQIQEHNQQGIYQLVLLDTQGQSAQGEIILTGNKPVRWRVEPQDSSVRIVFIGLQPVFGHWRQRIAEEHWCADIQISVSDHADL